MNTALGDDNARLSVTGISVHVHSTEVATDTHDVTILLRLTAVETLVSL